MSLRAQASDRRERDRLRTARLLLSRELADGTVAESALADRTVRRVARVGAVPPRALRLAELAARRAGLLDYDRRVAGPLRAARATALAGAHGSGASGFAAARAGGRGAGVDIPAASPRLLVRVDEFPHYQAWDEPERFGSVAFERFHEIMRAAGVPYLIAALPRLSRSPLSPQPLGSRGLRPEEVAVLKRLVAEGVTLALHGLDHRTREASPRRHSELSGLGATATEQLLDRGLAELAGHGLAAPEVFVAPYNRFDAAQLEILARRFAVVCGGPESIGTLGFQRPPQWRGDCVYLPAYSPFYGHAASVLGALERDGEWISGLWTPVVLHWGWEAQAGWAELERLAERMAPWAVPWSEFIAAVERSRGTDER
ncbi:MAG TPA: DUF2334 domain-containing protein, partial [Solirubrobacteraceae bacterium]|nr:DUF2334 domain-containing protein [Solirubrobacteraceae bacterium]